jgi:hypothetical protein
MLYRDLCRGDLRRGTLSQSLVRAFVGSFVVFACFMLSITNSSIANTAAAKQKTGAHLPMIKKRAAELKSALPLKVDGYTIGNPHEKNDYPGVDSGIDNPDAKDFQIKKNYYINCLSKHGGLVPVYKKWHNGPQQKEIRGLGK